MLTLVVLAQLLTGTTQHLKINPANVDTTIVVECPGDTDFEPGFRFKVQLTDGTVVELPFYPCKDAGILHDRKEHTHRQTARVNARTFIVEYYIPNNNDVLASSLSDKPVYKAQVTIYELAGREKKKLDGPAPGFWSEKRCADDDTGLFCPGVIVKAWMNRTKAPRK